MASELLDARGSRIGCRWNRPPQVDTTRDQCESTKQGRNDLERLHIEEGRYADETPDDKEESAPLPQHLGPPLADLGSPAQPLRLIRWRKHRRGTQRWLSLRLLGDDDPHRHVEHQAGAT